MAVYLIREGVTEFYKIGFTSQPVRLRLNSLQTAHRAELSLIATIEDGGIDEETVLHRRFQVHRIRGEWFQFPKDVLSEVLLAFDDMYGTARYRIQNAQNRALIREWKALTEDEKDARMVDAMVRLEAYRSTFAA